MGGYCKSEWSTAASYWFCIWNGLWSGQNNQRSKQNRLYQTSALADKCVRLVFLHSLVVVKDHAYLHWKPMKINVLKSIKINVRESITEKCSKVNKKIAHNNWIVWCEWRCENIQLSLGLYWLDHWHMVFLAGNFNRISVQVCRRIRWLDYTSQIV